MKSKADGPAFARIVCFRPGSSAFILYRIVCFGPEGLCALDPTQCDPVQLISNIFENPESERMAPVTQMELSQLGRLVKSEGLKILKSLILTQFGFSK